MNKISVNSYLPQLDLTACYHCGDDCTETPIKSDEKIFCCEGCKMVYGILNENGLVNYYQLNNTAGISQKNQGTEKYSFLDDQDAIDKLIDFTDEKIIKVRFYLPQIHCAACIWLLEHLHKLNEGIIQSRVNFLKKEVQLSFLKKKISLRETVLLLASIGYPPLIQLNDLEKDSKPKTDKTIYYKLGLAGFAFGNIMLLSFPEYLGMDLANNGLMASFFGLLNIALVIPVVLYSGQDYLRSAWQGLRQGHLNIDVPVSLGILALFFRSIYEIVSHTGVGYLDSLAGLIFFLLIGKWFQQTTFATISFDRDYKSYFPISTQVQKGKDFIQVTLDKLKEGDVLMIRNGELIPADGVLLSPSAKIDYSFVSGEAALVRKEKNDLLYAGGRQMGGIIKVQMTQKVSNSYLTQLWNDHTFSKSNNQGNVSVLAQKVARFFTWGILSVAIVTLFFWLFKDPSIAINAFTAVLIVACPCAVALSIPFTFGNLIRVLARQGIYLKNIQVLESLAKIDHIVFDKTGTITDTKKSQLIYNGTTLSEEEKKWVRSLVHHSTHPLSRQVYDYFSSVLIAPVTDFKEFTGKGIQGWVGGHFVQIGSASFLDNSLTKKEANKQHVFIVIDEKLKGSFEHKNEYRKGLTEVITKFKEQFSLSLLSGDNDSEKEYLLNTFGFKPEQLKFNKSPENKLASIRALQKTRLNIAMIGDGLNDAGALKQSDVGIVITEDTSNFTPACDMILSAAQFEKLPDLFVLAKQSVRLIYIAYFIALIYNIIGLTYAVQGNLSPVIAAILMPLSSVTIVLFGVGASFILAYRKGFLNVDKSHR